MGQPKTGIGDLSYDSPLTRKINYFLPLSDAECAEIQTLEQNQITFGRHVDVIRLGETYDRVYVVQEGWAIRHKETNNGERLIANFILPGDFVCLNACLFELAEFTVTTLTPVTMAHFGPDRLLQMSARQPRLALAVAWCNAREESILFEHLVNLGRRPAYQRLAHLLLELWRRLTLLDLTDDGHFPLPVTQMEMADSLGLSLSHVNRTLRRLHDDNLIRIDAHSDSVKSITILDAEGLTEAADFEDDFLHFTEIPRGTASLFE